MRATTTTWISFCFLLALAGVAQAVPPLPPTLGSGSFEPAVVIDVMAELTSGASAFKKDKQGWKLTRLGPALAWWWATWCTA